MKTWKIPVTWEMCGNVVVEAATLEEAMKNENAKRNLADTAEQVYRTFTIL